jgi:hypothetical protein
MEKNIVFLKQSLKKNAKKIMFSFALSVALLITLVTAYAKLKPTVLNFVQKQVISKLKISEIQWEELGNTNSSVFIDKDELGKIADLKPGQEFLSLDLSKVEEKLKKIPWISEVQIQKRLPSSVLVQYSTVPIKAILQRKNKLWYLSETGKIIAPVNLEIVIDVPILISDSNLDDQFLWMDTFEKEAPLELISVLEMQVDSRGGLGKVTSLVEVFSGGGTYKTSLITPLKPDSERVQDFKKVLTYLNQSHLKAVSFDLRTQKKIVVNLLKRS